MHVLWFRFFPSVVFSFPWFRLFCRQHLHIHEILNFYRKTERCLLCHTVDTLWHACTAAWFLVSTSLARTSLFPLPVLYREQYWYHFHSVSPRMALFSFSETTLDYHFLVWLFICIIKIRWWGERGRIELYLSLYYETSPGHNRYEWAGVTNFYPTNPSDCDFYSSFHKFLFLVIWYSPFVPFCFVKYFFNCLHISIHDSVKVGGAKTGKGTSSCRIPTIIFNFVWTWKDLPGSRIAHFHSPCFYPNLPFFNLFIYTLRLQLHKR